MLIGLCGPRSAGKGEVAKYLAQELGFTILENASLLSESSTGSDRQNGECQEVIKPSEQLISQCWRSNINIVIRRIEPHDASVPDLFKRPYFLLIYIDAPFLARFERAVASELVEQKNLYEFAKADDLLRYVSPKLMAGRETNGVLPENAVGKETKIRALDGQFSVSSLQRKARLCIMNDFDLVEDFVEHLRGINFTDSERLRPSWDSYFMSLAKLAAQRTNCMKRRVGCVIARNKRMVATGYNGTPSGVKNCSEGGCGRCNGARNVQGVGLDLCLCLHAEENAIIEAGRERCEGSTLYTNLFPCILCSKKIVQAGISRIVFDKHYATDGAAESLLRAGNVVVDAFRREDISRTLSDLTLGGPRS